jgi:hypothetical protein
MSMELKFGGKRPSRTRIVREQRTQLLEQLRRDAERIAARFGLRYRAIEAENGHVKRRYGSCHSDGVIKIRLTHVTTGRPLKYSSMVATLCHEIAHLKYFHHGPRFRDFNDVIVDWARSQGIYRPEVQRRRTQRAQPAPTRPREAQIQLPPRATRVAPVVPEQMNLL